MAVSLFSALSPGHNFSIQGIYAEVEALRLFHQSLHYLDLEEWENALRSLEDLCLCRKLLHHKTKAYKDDVAKCNEELRVCIDKLSVGSSDKDSPFAIDRAGMHLILKTDYDLLFCNWTWSNPTIIGQACQMLRSQREHLSAASAPAITTENLEKLQSRQGTKTSAPSAPNVASHTSKSTRSSRFGITYSVGTASTGCSLVSNSVFMVPG